MAKQPDSNRSYQDRSFHDTHESLEALVRLLARQLAREHFAAARPAAAKDKPSTPTREGDANDE